MQKLGELLFRFAHLAIPEETVRKETQKVIEELTGEHVPIADIALVRGALRVHATPILRQKIFLKQKVLLQKLSETLNKKTPHAIRFK